MGAQVKFTEEQLKQSSLLFVRMFEWIQHMDDNLAIGLRSPGAQIVTKAQMSSDISELFQMIRELKRILEI